VRVSGEHLARWSERATTDVSHLLRTSHIKQLRTIFDHPEASANDRFVALELLKNAVVASGMVLPVRRAC
jgi:fumarate hydratase class I